jgi:serine/threonine protein phosphatase PrpC
LRVWLKGEEKPGLTMTRAIGDQMAASVGVTCEPDIKVSFLERDNHIYSLLIGSDGLWNTHSVTAIKKNLKLILESY